MTHASKPGQPQSDLERRLACWDETSDEDYRKRTEGNTDHLKEPEWVVELSQAELEEVERAIG